MLLLNLLIEFGSKFLRGVIYVFWHGFIEANIDNNLDELIFITGNTLLL